MKILLLGSIASGKTTIAKQFVKLYSEFEYQAIDDYRKHFGDNSMKGESLAQEQFLESISNNKTQIIEASGLGEVGKRILEIIKEIDTNILIVVLYLSETEIKNRLTNRNWDIPFPDKQKNLDNIISTINYGIEFGRIPMMWSEVPNTTILQIENKDLETQKFILNTINNYLKLNK